MHSSNGDRARLSDSIFKLLLYVSQSIDHSQPFKELLDHPLDVEVRTDLDKHHTDLLNKL